MFSMRKRWWVVAAAGAIVGAAVVSTSPMNLPTLAAMPAATSAVPLVRGVVKIGMTVSDLDRSIAFYHDVLGFEKVSEREVVGKAMERLTGVFGLRCRIAEMKLGDEVIELTEYLASPGRPYPADSRSHDRWFQHIAIITSDMEQAYARLRAAKVKHASTGPQTLPEWNKNAAGIKAFYFRDPDGHVLEVLQFPVGKGGDRWQAKGSSFLGIDHTAIVVADTEKSLAFYRDLLGMKVVGGSENSGDEQEHLNNVEGARLRITTLRAGGTGPAVELLEYQMPRDGRDYPADAKPNDVLHWQTTVAVGDVTEAFRVLRDAGVRTLSAGPIRIDRATDVFLLRDPDGHAFQMSR